MLLDSFFFRVLNDKLALIHPDKSKCTDKNKKVDEVVGFLKSVISEYSIEPFEQERENIFKLSMKGSAERIQLEYMVYNLSVSRIRQPPVLGSRSVNYETRSKLILDRQAYYINFKGTEIILSWLLDGYHAPTVPLNGNRIEIVCLQPALAMLDEDWDDWKRYNQVYEAAIYPECLSVLGELVQTLDKPSLKILEICGGNGGLAQLILNMFGPRISHYELVDRNKISIQRAKRCLDEDYRERFTAREFDIVEGNYSDEKVDLVLGVGALTRGVLPSRESALQALDKVIAKINYQGFLVLAGFESHWVFSEDFEARGLSIKNMASHVGLQQLYIVQKK